MPRNINYFLFAFALVCLGITSQMLVANSQTLTTTQQEQTEPLPKGKWKVATIFDLKQHENPSVPVELTRVTSAMKEGNNSRLVELIIKSRTSKNISGIKIRYYLTTEDATETILFEGPPLEIVSLRAKEEKVALPSNQKRTFSVLNGQFAKLIKPLVKNGTLNGSFIIKLRVSEVSFDDGSFWKDNESINYNHAQPARASPLQSTCPGQICVLQNDTNGNVTGLQICESRDVNIYKYWCYVNPNTLYCNYDACNENGTIPDRDNDGYSADEDCNDDPNAGGANINPGTSEKCSDGIDNDCDGLVDCDDSGCAIECPQGCTPEQRQNCNRLFLSGWRWNETNCQCICILAGGCGSAGETIVCNQQDRLDCYATEGFRWVPETCECLPLTGGDPLNPPSPVLVDVSGNGFALTDAERGVNFDINNDGVRERVA